jgi:hypothetical protein
VNFFELGDLKGNKEERIIKKGLRYLKKRNVPKGFLNKLYIKIYFK